MIIQLDGPNDSDSDDDDDDDDDFNDAHDDDGEDKAQVSHKNHLRLSSKSLFRVGLHSRELILCPRMATTRERC